MWKIATFNAALSNGLQHLGFLSFKHFKLSVVPPGTGEEKCAREFLRVYFLEILCQRPSDERRKESGEGSCCSHVGAHRVPGGAETPL